MSQNLLMQFNTFCLITLHNQLWNSHIFGNVHTNKIKSTLSFIKDCRNQKLKVRSACSHINSLHFFSFFFFLKNEIEEQNLQILNQIKNKISIGWRQNLKKLQNLNAKINKQNKKKVNISKLI